MSEDKDKLYRTMADFNRGYQDGKSGINKGGGAAEALIEVFTFGLLGLPKESEAYNKGYEAGKKNK